MTTFTGGIAGQWRIERLDGVRGEPLAPAARLAIGGDEDPDAAWTLRGASGYERYVLPEEEAELKARSPELGRPEATHAALIPIRKSAAWWALPQDDRRSIFEERSHHIATGLRYLPRVARRLYHCRDPGDPFDFLTWFEFALDHAEAFEELVGLLRETEEWSYVEREVDLRLAREG